MAYADRNTTGSRMVAIVIVSLIVVAFGYAFITGLTYKYVKAVQDKLKTFNVDEPPPPPPQKPPPPPPDTPLQPPPVVSPPPIVHVPSPPPIMQTVQTPPPVYIPTPAPPPPAPPPPPPVVNRAAGPKGNPADWVSQDDYPAAALRAEAQGRTSIAWDINLQGRVENCHVTSSSGNADLDEAACRAITRRGKYSPALDQSGNPIRSAAARTVRWVLPAGE